MTERRDRGYSLVTLMVTVAVMLILMTAAIPSWRYVMRNDREEELLARGGEIADAIFRYQRKNGNALPPSLEALVKGKFLRHAYKDPMTKDGKWRFIRPGEAIGPMAPGGAGVGGTGSSSGSGTSGFDSRSSGRARPSGSSRFGSGSSSDSSLSGSTSSGLGTGGSGSGSSSTFPQPGTAIGGFLGVASTSTEKSLRVFNGRTRYNEWVFLPGQPRVVGRPIGPAVPQPGGGVRPPGTSSGPGGTVTRP